MSEVDDLDHPGFLVLPEVDEVGSLEDALAHRLAESFACVFVDGESRHRRQSLDGGPQPIFPRQRVVDLVPGDEQHLLAYLLHDDRRNDKPIRLHLLACLAAFIARSSARIGSRAASTSKPFPSLSSRSA